MGALSQIHFQFDECHFRRWPRPTAWQVEESDLDDLLPRVRLEMRVIINAFPAGIPGGEQLAFRHDSGRSGQDEGSG